MFLSILLNTNKQLLQCPKDTPLSRCCSWDTCLGSSTLPSMEWDLVDISSTVVMDEEVTKLHCLDLWLEGSLRTTVCKFSPLLVTVPQTFFCSFKVQNTNSLLICSSSLFCLFKATDFLVFSIRLGCFSQISYSSRSTSTVTRQCCHGLSAPAALESILSPFASSFRRSWSWSRSSGGGGRGSGIAGVQGTCPKVNATCSSSACTTWGAVAAFSWGVAGAGGPARSAGRRFALCPRA